jgi:hypothetical protein
MGDDLADSSAGSVSVAPNFLEKSSRGATSPAGLSVDAIGDQGGTGKRLAAGECTNACVDRFLAESGAVATGETVPSRVLVQMALCAVTALSALSFGRPQDSPRVKSHRRRSRRETHHGSHKDRRPWPQQDYHAEDHRQQAVEDRRCP